MSEPRDDLQIEEPSVPLNGLTGQRVLEAMVERLLGAMTSGPAMNCRPHSSRQRIDLVQFERLGDLSPDDILLQLLGAAGKTRVAASVPPVPASVMARHRPRGRGRWQSRPSRSADEIANGGLADAADEVEALSPEERAALQAWEQQHSVLNKLRAIAEDARAYEQDTGVPALGLGFPLLSLPPGGSVGGGALTRRILAPVAFLPLHMAVRAGPKTTVELACRGEGAERVHANETLLVWLAQRGGTEAAELFEDAEGENTWRELRELVRHVASLVGADVPAIFDADAAPERPGLATAPNAEQADQWSKPMIVPAAVLGLYPSANQGLLRDAQAMAAGEDLNGPVRSFVHLGERLAEEPPAEQVAAPGSAPARDFAGERLVAPCDPCQMQAVRLARVSRGLVIHGPPGTGKSQTITNIVADHLARGERVLFVCDKRTALDVVFNRLDHLGLGGLCALIHDPQRDRADLYRKIRQQLDELPERKTRSSAAKRLEAIDQELTRLHSELTGYHAALLKADPAADPPLSLHDLIGRWLGAAGPETLVPEDHRLSVETLAAVAPGTLAGAHNVLRDALERGRMATWGDNPWREAAGWSLADLLSRPMDEVRRMLAEMADEAGAADTTRHESIPPFDGQLALPEQAAARTELHKRLRAIPADHLPPAAAPLAGLGAEELDDARGRIAQVQAHAAFILKNGLPEAELSARAGAVTAADAAQKRDAMRAYVEAVRLTASRIEKAEAAAREAGGEGLDVRAIALHWLSAGEAARQKLGRQLAAAEPLAQQVEAGAPDASLMRQFKRQPFDAAELVQRRAAVAEYEQAAAGIFGFLAFGKKKAAAPTMRHFGLGVNGATARQMREFLDQLRARLDLRDALVEALDGVSGGAESLADPGEVDDILLLRAFRAHRAVASTLDARPGDPAPAPDDPALLEVIHAAVPAAVESAKAALEALGLLLSPSDAERARLFYAGVVALEGLRGVSRRLMPGGDLPDDRLPEILAAVDRLLEILQWLAGERAARGLARVVGAAVRDGSMPVLLEGLRRSPARAEAIRKLDIMLSAAGMLAAAWRRKLDVHQRKGGEAAPAVCELRDRAGTLEAVLRVRQALADQPPVLAAAMDVLLEAGAEPVAALAALRKQTDAAEIRRRLVATPELQAADAKRLRDAFDQYRRLQSEKFTAVRDAIVHAWSQRQKSRLLAATGTRLSGLGADLRRRLVIRGKRMMRLRQMVRAGHGTEGGDPLFDLCPVWMASPETVAQVFSREPVFDVVVFDEASQVRLEESLPVLTRARRVVIAGDPKQLPPTRFFETTFTTSQDQEAETDQELFEQQQSETEDLLGAALGLDIQQCFLDVHYRSRNADLIGFSNEQFYGARLQPIPGHPKNRTPYAPVRLYAVEGIYEDRQNEAEAEQVVRIVRDLLKWSEPPSIGIACFNLPQRDLILEKLDEAAAGDAGFARRLAQARERRGEGSFEGLFVKNLENVQGDERDHIIISTTYGPSAEGKFRRNFGPVSQAGGGRRLNVLVTRARQEIHVVTSIPPSEYRQLPAVPEGQQPTGRWLLYAYLQYAEQLQDVYERPATGDGEVVPQETPEPDAADADVPETDGEAEAEPASEADEAPEGSEQQEVEQTEDAMVESAAEAPADGEAVQADAKAEEATAEGEATADGAVEESGVAMPVAPAAEVRVLPTQAPSLFAEAFAATLMREGIGSEVYWGNEGFGIDVVLKDAAARDGGATVAVLCDLTRFAGTDDPVEWEAFRTLVHESQGWPLVRAWTPHVFRDPAGVLKSVAEAHGQALATGEA